ncbi:hypothetical protein O3P69_002785 [Scylla paramamosain]|uniref:Uncharacterized protein n=1 Tax=Scylla paramamosain TaxID=85552 RepID=A0AAW0UM91_SCYPA
MKRAVKDKSTGNRAAGNEIKGGKPHKPTTSNLPTTHRMERWIDEQDANCLKNMHLLDTGWNQTQKKAQKGVACGGTQHRTR